jgi:hypothetical protein
VLRRELAAGRSPEQIEQIEFVGDTLHMASVLQWKRKNLPTADPALRQRTCSASRQPRAGRWRLACGSRAQG